MPVVASVSGPPKALPPEVPQELKNSPPLVPSVATLAEILRAAGYATHALTGGGFVSDSMGLGQGFDDFLEDWSVDDAKGQIALRVASFDASRPFLHTYDAHEPYGRKDPPEGHDDPARVAEVNAYVKSLQARMPEPDSDPPVEEGRRLLLGLRADPLLKQALFARFGREIVRLPRNHSRGHARRSGQLADQPHTGWRA